PPAGGERAVADAVENGVIASARVRAFRWLPRRGEEILPRVVDHVVRAERPHEIDVPGAADAGDFGPEPLRDLNGEGSDAARGAVDRDPLPGLDSGLVAQTLQCGEAGDGCRRRLLERDVG